ncbi:MAG: hypothetical protein P9L94_03115 [Candidatus Hinthialibacter antarcticus]|nr:hypothetical protein [Candidatus Hinthialibacter antarcticus]
MNARAVFIFCCMAVVFSGCYIPFLQPLYDEHNLVYSPTLLGVWHDDEDGQWTFSERSGTKLYKLTYVQDGGKEAEFEAALCEIEGRQFLNTIVVDLKGEGDLTKFHLLPVYHIFWVEWNDGLKLHPLSPDWLGEMLEKEHALPFVIGRDDIKLVSASTDQIQAFISEHVGDDKMYGDPIELKRTD